MAGKIVADTLEHSTAGSIATNYVVNGSAKQFATYGTDAVIDTSLNTSSISDIGTGQFDSNYTNNMNTANEGFACTVWGTPSVSIAVIRTSTTSMHRVNSYTTGSANDDEPQSTSVVGNLA